MSSCIDWISVYTQHADNKSIITIESRRDDIIHWTHITVNEKTVTFCSNSWLLAQVLFYSIWAQNILLCFRISVTVRGVRLTRSLYRQYCHITRVYFTNSLNLSTSKRKTNIPSVCVGDIRFAVIITKATIITKNIWVRVCHIFWLFSL